MNIGEDSWQQAVARHGEPDARLPDLVDEDRRDHAHERAQQHHKANPIKRMAAGQKRELLERVDHGRRVADHGLPWNQAGEAHGDRDVEHRADDQCGDDADGKVALRIVALLGRSGDGIEANVREENNGAASEHARPSVGHEGMPVGWMNIADDGEDEDQNRNQLESHHHIVGRSRLADAAHQDHRENQHDEERGNVKTEVPAVFVYGVAGQILQAAGKIGGRDPSRAGVQAEPVQQVDHVRGKAHADAHVRAGVFENQIPADDPGDQFAEGRVGVGVGRAGNRNHRRELGVAEPGERADKGHHDHGNCDGGAGAGPAGERGVRDDVTRQRCVHHAGSVKLFPGDRRADDGEDARANDRADAESRERPRTEGPPQPVFGLFRLPNQLIDRFAREVLAGQ